MMKFFILTFAYLFSIPVAAQDHNCQRLEDGSCYNDDYLGEEKGGGKPKIPFKPDEPPHIIPPGIAVGEPNPNGPKPRFPIVKKPKKPKKFKPKNLFEPIDGDDDNPPGFVPVGDHGPDPKGSDGSK